MNELTTITTDGAQPAVAYLFSLNSEVGRATMTTELRKIARLMGVNDWQAVNWATLNAANVSAIMGKVKGAPASRNKTLAALKGVARAAWRLELMDSEQLARIRDIGGDGGKREPTGREVEAWEIAALMRVCAKDTSPAGIRDGAIIALAAKTGARREELVSVNMADIMLTSDGAEIRVIGKRNKQRTLYVEGGAMNALSDWLAVRGAEVGKDAPLFVCISQTGIIGNTAPSTTALHKMLMKRAAEAGLSNLTWHDLRRTFAGKLLDAGEDIATVAQLMGHSSVNTTARYDRRPAEARRKAARKVSVPYFKRSAG